MDIGWERDPSDAEAKEHLASCAVDEKKHPHGLKPISDACHALGMKYLLWFGSGRLWPAVERVHKFRPEWLSSEYPGTDSGNPTINNYLIEHFGNKFAAWGIDVFRPDAHSTVPPDSAADRQGINQARSAAGFIRFWDALLQRFPHLMIDNCCAGGENIDLETIRRSIALWRSDYQVDQHFNPIGMQGQTYGLSFWVPLSAGAIGDACRAAGVEKQPDPYSIRSAYSPALVVTWFGNDQTMPGDRFDYKTARRLLNEYVSVRKYFLGDYYPLTRYNLDETKWLAWQFDRPDLGEGMVQIFRRGKSPDESGKFQLHGLQPEAVYKLTNPDVAADDANQRSPASGERALDCHQAPPGRGGCPVQENAMTATGGFVTSPSIAASSADARSVRVSIPAPRNRPSALLPSHRRVQRIIGRQFDGLLLKHLEHVVGHIGLSDRRRRRRAPRTTCRTSSTARPCPVPGPRSSPPAT